MPTKLGNLLREARGGRSIVELARQLNVNKNTLGAYERGQRTPSVGFLSRFSATTRTPLGKLLMAGVLDAGNPAHVLADLVPSAGLAEAPAPYRAAGRDELEKGFVLVPRYDIQAAAGAGSFADVEEVADWLAFKEEWVRRVLRVHPAKLVLVEATGDSMEPAVRSGDLLLLDTGVNRVLDDTIYVLVKDGAVVVKRVQKFMGGAVIIKSDNPAYVEETIPPHDVADLRIAGRVRWIGRLI